MIDCDINHAMVTGNQQACRAEGRVDALRYMTRTTAHECGWFIQVEDEVYQDGALSAQNANQLIRAAIRERTINAKD